MILIAGIEGHICEVCVEQAGDIVQEELYGGADPKATPAQIPAAGDYTGRISYNPQQIKSHLDEYIIGYSNPKLAHFQGFLELSLFKIISCRYC